MSREKGKHGNKGKRMIISKIIMLICIGLMIYSAIHIFIWWQENQKSKEILESVKKEVKIDTEKDITDEEKYTVNISELNKTNDDIVGWIKVWGTDIEMPVVQTNDNEYYLTHSLDKSYNSAGWAFVDFSNKLDGTDKNIVIYGHNRRDNSIFGTLKNILDEDWYSNKDNLYIPFIQEKDGTIYEVFSVYEIENEEYYIQTSFNNEEFKSFINVIKNRSIKDFNIDVSENDQILTLSSCADDSKYRVVLHAKKIKKSDSNNKENKSLLASKEDLNLKDIDGKNYTFLYNNEKFNAEYTKDNWKIIYSYKIKNKEDMKIICQALIDIHPIHGSDGKSYRTADDMVEEWGIHNTAYDILPEDSEWKVNARDVDLDSSDQGKNFEEILKDRLKMLTN